MPCLALVRPEVGVCLCSGWSVDGSLESQVLSFHTKGPGRTSGRDTKYTTAPQKQRECCSQRFWLTEEHLIFPETSAPNPPGVCVCVLGGEPGFWLEGLFRFHYHGEQLLVHILCLEKDKGKTQNKKDRPFSVLYPGHQGLRHVTREGRWVHTQCLCTDCCSLGVMNPCRRGCHKGASHLVRFWRKRQVCKLMGAGCQVAGQ